MRLPRLFACERAKRSVFVRLSCAKIARSSTSPAIDSGTDSRITRTGRNPIRIRSAIQACFSHLPIQADSGRVLAPTTCARAGGSSDSRTVRYIESHPSAGPPIRKYRSFALRSSLRTRLSTWTGCRRALLQHAHVGLREHRIADLFDPTMDAAASCRIRLTVSPSLSATCWVVSN